jgi:hypothetical protein
MEVGNCSAEAMDACVASGMLHLDEQRLAFRHELAREAVLNTLPPARRKLLHGKALHTLRSRPVEPGDLARLAEHAEAAEDAAAVLEFAPQAGRFAASVSAHREAAAQFQRALNFSHGLEPTQRALLLEEFGAEVHISGGVSAAITARSEAVEIWRASGDRLREGESLARLASSLVVAGRNAECEEAIRAALDVLEALPPGSRGG